MTAGSLFSGCGGIDLGLEMAGVDVLWQVEKDQFCRDVLTKHWPHVRKYQDIREINGKDLARVDLIAGGDPCQENSNARRSGLSTTQKSLGAEFIRIVAESRPRFVLRENPARVRSDAPWPWFRFRNCLEALGYTVLPFRLRACCLGFKHQRERLFLLGTLPDPMRPRWQRGLIPELADAATRPLCSPRPPWGYTTSRICGVADGIPNRPHRLKALGNADVPEVISFIVSRL